jgi:hypothetical protein
VTQTRHPDRAHAPGTLILHGMPLAEQRRILRSWEAAERRRLAREPAAPADAPAPAPAAEAPPAVVWAPLWQLDDDAPPLPSPAEVRERRRRRRREALVEQLWSALAPRARELLAADLPAALDALGVQRRRDT